MVRGKKKNKPWWMAVIFEETKVVDIIKEKKITANCCKKLGSY